MCNSLQRIGCADEGVVGVVWCGVVGVVEQLLCGRIGCVCVGLYWWPVRSASCSHITVLVFVVRMHCVNFHDLWESFYTFYFGFAFWIFGNTKFFENHFIKQAAREK